MNNRELPDNNASALSFSKVELVLDTPRLCLCVCLGYIRGCEGGERILTQSNLPFDEIKLMFMHFPTMNEISSFQYNSVDV